MRLAAVFMRHFKTARMHLLEAMPGDSAFKRGRPVEQEQEDGEAEPIAAAPAPEEGGAPCE